MEQQANQFTPNQPEIFTPGMTKEKKVRAITLTVVVLVVLVSLSVWLFPIVPKTKSITPEQKQALLGELSKTVRPVTAEQKKALLNNLNSTNNISLSQSQKEALLNNLNN